ncbi:MAG: hypothetical protein L6R41_002620 [Letrouitia leprolyta]|nr:MAG: hypothetical protein L6R41_002620 [Letrouitia leprolyta]
MKRDVERDAVSPPPAKRKIASTTTKKAVAGFFTPASKKEPDRTTWRVINKTLLSGRYRLHPDDESSQGQGPKRRKVAAFDFDSTLISTSSGNIFAKDATDWRWWYISVPTTLRQLYADGYLIAILSNQGSIGLKDDPKSIKGDQKLLSNFKAKVNSVFNQLDIPIVLLAASARDRYRKPRTGMWTELIEDFDLDIGDGPDLKASFFVGDAGGRAARGAIKADYSCSDRNRNFAANLGIEYRTPEEFFLHEPTQPFTRDFDPSDYLRSLDVGPIVFEKKNAIDIVLFCGSPGSGKSTFYRKHLQPLGYERVNQDTLKTLAQKFKVPIRCVYFTASHKICEHNDTVRALAGEPFNPDKRTILPHSAFSSFASRFKQPTAQEGFQDLVSIDFQVDRASGVGAAD